MYECFLLFFFFVFPCLWLEASFPSAEPPETSAFLRNFLLDNRFGNRFCFLE